MNKITRSKDLMVPKVTTGPISASTKVYSSPEGHADVRVPFREIALSEGAGEPPSASTTHPAPTPTRTPPSTWRRACRASAKPGCASAAASRSTTAATIKPEDNGNVVGKHLARDFPNKPPPLRGLPGKPVTQSSSRAPASSPRR